jgi:hypothetical protein
MQTSDRSSTRPVKQRAFILSFLADRMLIYHSNEHQSTPFWQCYCDGLPVCLIQQFVCGLRISVVRAGLQYSARKVSRCFRKYHDLALYKRTYSKSKGWRLIPVFGGAIRLAIFPLDVRVN